MASKVAVRALIDGLRLDACNLGIGLTLLEPGFVTTEMTEGIRYRMPFLLDADRAAAVFVRGIEAGHERVRTPWQMAAINYLAGYVPRPLRNRAALWLAERT
jgi:short-subunit dehydrogenase